MELLAPSDKNTFFEAINNGADAVYIGLKDFSARQSADNITLEELDYYLSYAHLFGVKVYCAVNTLVKDEELSNYFNLILSAYSKGVDAFILQDIFLGKFLKEKYPDITLHLSTQAGVNNIFSAKLAKKYGFSRVILSRETAINEIEEIAKEIETEVFVHGALCSSFSGQCYYSSYVGGNSGNRGRCKQPCRQPFYYQEKQLGKYNLSLSDLMLCDYIDNLRKIGVKSVKIEGRMRSKEYCAQAVSLYRKAIDGQDYSKDKEQIKRVYNRGDYTTGYYLSDNNLISDKIQSHKGAYFGQVIQINKNTLICDKKATEGDCFKILRNGYEVGNCTCVNGKFVFKGLIKKGDLLYITKDICLINKISNKRLLKEINISIKINNDKLIAFCVQNQTTYTSESIVQLAQNTPTTQQEVINNFNKTDIYPFSISVNFVGNFSNIFIPKSQLNAFRREVLKNIFTSYQNIKNIKISDISLNNYNYSVSEKTSIIISDIEDFNIFADKYIFFPSDYNSLSNIVNSKEFLNCNKEKYIFIPAFLNDEDFSILSKFIPKFDGIYADGLCGIVIAEQFNKKLFIGMGLNVFNSLTYSIIMREFPNCDVVLSKELEENKTYGNSYRFNKGSIAIMHLIYCPFRNNCGNCSKEWFFESKDSYESFKLRRFKLSSCRFMLYPKKIIAGSEKGNKLINLISLSKEQKIELFKNNLKYSFNKGVL